MQNTRIAMDQEKYQKEFDELVERHRKVKEEYEKQVLSSEQDVGRVAQIDYFIRKIICCNFQNSAYNTDEHGNSSSTKFFRVIDL